MSLRRVEWRTERRIERRTEQPPIESRAPRSERFFYLGDQQAAYLDTISANGTVDTYRGQNSNMHMCEMLIAAYEATNNRTYLARAEALAHTFAVVLAAKAGGFVGEHYDEHWNINWNYNIDDPSNIYRPWGFQPGHQMEWAKNLLNLNRHEPAAWKVQRARELFDAATAPQSKAPW